ncbi:MAG: UvrD-helicase domain-containing protein [Planctomycetota bacterium]|nr:UvrD-helicase domain-containing protein [Planctomycetota bacterium]
MFDSLTEAQSEAVKTVEGPLLILAGPGSGKTRVVTHRTAYMVQQGVPPRRILTLTFTNKAADEMQNRLSQLAPDATVWTSTFHKFCSKTLRQYGGYVGLEENYTILDASDSKKALKQTVEEHDIELFKYSESQVLNKISSLKNQLLAPEDFQPRPGVPMDAIVEKIYPLYQNRLLRSNAVDFDDLLLHVARLLMNHPDVREDLDARYQYISVDEYQDTNYAQYMILKMLSVNHRNLAVTGDPDQSIYGWRGANIRNILDFEKDFPETRVVKLEKNYRSTPNILEVADHLIDYNTQRKEKKLFTDNQPGSPVRLVAYPNQHEEASQIAEQIQNLIASGKRRPQEIAVFYRTNVLSRSLEHSLRSQGIPFQIVKGHEFYQRKEIKDVIAYLHLINNPKNDVAFERIINVPARKIGKVTIDRLKQYAFENRLCLLEAAWNADRISALKGNAKKNVQKFAEMMVRLRSQATELVSSVITQVYLETEYRNVLLSSDHPEDEERAANLDELLNAAHEFDLEYGELGGLDVYLDQASLVSDVDAWETESDKVTLMTLHAAKGLEFPQVFIVALEDGILPHSRSMESDSEIEEERRLFFVGITRAKQELQISRSLYRSKKGRLWPTIPSAFLMELPRESMEVHEPRRHGGSVTDEFQETDSGTEAAYFQDSQFEEPSFSYGDSPEDAGPMEEDVPFDVFVDEDEQSPQPAAAEREEADPVLPSDSLPTGESERNAAAISGDLPRLKTAAEMMAGGEAEAGLQMPPGAFQENMLVSHPDYGVGRILSISRAGSRQTAQVDFVSIGQKKFVLSHSRLKPVTES